jgi:hypothetical protein
MKTNFKFTPVFALLLAALLWAMPMSPLGGRVMPICTDNGGLCQPFPPTA